MVYGARIAPTVYTPLKDFNWVGSNSQLLQQLMSTFIHLNIINKNKVKQNKKTLPELLTTV